MTNTQEETNDAMKAKKDLIEQRMKDRQNERDSDRYINKLSLSNCIFDLKKSKIRDKHRRFSQTILS